MPGEELEPVVVPGVDLRKAPQPVVPVPSETRVTGAGVQTREHMRAPFPEGLGARPVLQQGQHEQVALREDDVGRGDAARLAQHGEPFGLRGEGVVRRRIAEGLGEHRRAVASASHPRGRGESSGGRFHRGDVTQAGRVQA